MGEELQSKYLVQGSIKGQVFGEYEYFQIGASTFGQLKASNVIMGGFAKEFTNKKPDRLIIDRKDKKKSNVVAVVEDKDGGKFHSEGEKKKAIEQCNNYCQELGAKMGIVTDGTFCVWINPNEKNSDTEYLDETVNKKRSYSFIKKEDGSEITTDFRISDRQDLIDEERMSDDTRKTYKLIKEINKKINNKNSIVREPGRIDPLPLAKRVWQDIWVATGKSPEKCLYNVVELFIFKFLSDLEILTYPNDFDSLYKLIEKGTDPSDILRYYVKNCRDQIYKQFPKGKDDTTIINGTIFVDERGEPNTTQSLLFRDSINKFKDFEEEFGKFSTHNIDKDFKTKLYESFLKQTAGLKSLGQFFTPRKVVRSIVEMSGIRNFSGGERVCDPFCGVGGFVLEPLNFIERASDFKPKNKIIHSPVTYKGYDKGFEKDEERTIILAKANMLIYLAEIIAESKLTKEFSDIFNNTFTLWRSNLGTLGEITNKEEEKFNLILTNPPYVKRGIKTLKNEIENNPELHNFYKINGGGLEGLAVEWVIHHLKKGGKSFVIIPDGILNRLDDKKLRKFILQECFLDAIISLPQKAFYATPKKTYILAVTKKTDSTQVQDFPVFTYLVSNIGETLDVRRFETPEKNDLPEMVDLFGEYQLRRNKSDIKSLEGKSLRCKIQSVESFIPEKHWSVDRWWSKEEKVELGIEEEDQEITPQEFYELLDDSHKELGLILEQSQEILKKKSEELKKLDFKTISLSDKTYFKLAIGKRLLKVNLFNDRNNVNAKIPAYSANVYKSFGFVEKTNISSFSNPYVLWGIDGNFDLTHKPAGEVFASTDHCGTIEILDKNILPEYLLLALNLKKYEYGFDRGLRSNLVNVKGVEIEIPIDNKGDFDLSAQVSFVKKNNEIFELQNQIRNIKEDIEKTEINFLEDFDSIEKSLNEIFYIRQGNAYYTKKHIIGSNWHGNIPVYSSNTKENGLLMKMDLSKVKEVDLHFEQCLTWAVDGHAGKIFIRNEGNYENKREEKYFFTINNHCGILLPKVDNIYLPFIRWIIQPSFYRISKGYGNNKVGTNQIKDIQIRIPIDQNGEFSLEKQKEIALKYEKIAMIKEQLSAKLESLANHKLSIGD